MTALPFPFPHARRRTAAARPVPSASSAARWSRDPAAVRGVLDAHREGRISSDYLLQASASIERSLAR